MMSEGEKKSASVEQVAPDTQVIRAASMGEAERELRRAQAPVVVVLLPDGSDDVRKAVFERVWSKEGRRLVVAAGISDWREALGVGPTAAAPVKAKPTKPRSKKTPEAKAESAAAPPVEDAVPMDAEAASADDGAGAP